MTGRRDDRQTEETTMAVDDSYTKALLHLDGNDGSTSFVDESGRIWTNGPGNFAAKISTAHSKFGSGSIICGNPSWGGYISTPVTADLMAADQDYTIDCWQYFDASGNYAGLMWMVSQDSTHWIRFEYMWMGSGLYSVRFRIYNGAYYVTNVQSTPAAKLATGWHHFAAARTTVDGDPYLFLFIDGISVAAGYYPGDWPAYTGNVIIGDPTGGLFANIDEVRFSKGIARWTENFTPPTSPYGPPGLTVIAASFEGLSSMQADGPRYISAAPLEAVSSGAAAFQNNYPVAISAAALSGSASMTAAISLTGKLVVAVPFIAVAEISVNHAAGDNLLVLNLPALSMTGRMESRSGRIRAWLPHLQLTLTGLSGSLGSISARLPMLQLNLTVVSGTVGRITGSLSHLLSLLHGNTATHGLLAAILPGLQALLHAGIRYPIYKGIAMNPKIVAVTEYQDYPFNSFAIFQGVNLGATRAGIHKLTGPDDNGTEIDAEIDLGKIPVEYTKVRNVWVEGRASGDMRVVLSADEGTEDEFEEDYLLRVLGQDRVTVPRGLKPVYLQIGVKNENGSDFDIDAIQIVGERIERKKR